MKDSRVGMVFWLAARDPEFRRRFIADPGSAIPAEGFVLSDEEMATVRVAWESCHKLSDRGAYERICAIARGYAPPGR